MARNLRIYSLTDGGYYHVISRGNNKKEIFRDDSDYYTFKRYLKEYKQKYLTKVVAYVLMPNHYHLLLKAKTNLPALMSVFNSRYAMYFNKKYDLKGHLFQGRYKNFLVADDPYLITLIRYIHNNPVRANIIEDIYQYEHSSLREYAEKSNGIADKNIISNLLEKSSLGTGLASLLS